MTSFFRTLMAATMLSGVVATPALAQSKRAPTLDQRIGRLEKQVRQVQGKVFPKGQPVDTAGTDPEPAAPLSGMNTLAVRVGAVESQLAEIVRTTEEQDNRIALLEAETARLRASVDAATRALAAATATMPADGSVPVATPPSTQPATSRPPERDNLTPTPPRPVIDDDKPVPAATQTFTDPAERDYDAGYRMWLAKRYDAAFAALEKVARDYPGHRRVSWAHNLAGRALFDKGDYRRAADILLANYRRDPNGERAQDSLFFLGQANFKLGQPDRACRAYDELERVYGARLRSAIVKDLPAARTDAKCQ